MAEWTWQQEGIKAAFSAGVGAVTLGLGWIIGQRLTAKWTLRQKRRELELSAASELHRLYGEFFAVWKLWNLFKGSAELGGGKEIRWDLMQRAALIDAGVEALLLKVSAERHLTEPIISDLGMLRQGFQRLRESIKSDKSLPWHDADYPEYVEFKRAAGVLSNLLTSDHPYHRPDTRAAERAFKEITSNKFEDKFARLSSGRSP